MILAPIAAVLAALMFIGASIGGAGLTVHAREHLDDVVADEDRRDQADGILEEMETELVDAAEAHQEMVQGVAALTEDRAAGPAEFEALFAEGGLSDRDAQFIDRRFRLKNTLTREEWQELFPPPAALTGQ